MAAKTSAGLLMYRERDGQMEVLLVHLGGPFWKNKDHEAWFVPKGEINPGEDLLDAAKREFQEETGVVPRGDFVSLGSVKHKSGKTVHAWAFEGDLPESFELKSNLFEMEWPPRSGRLQSFPEVDQARFFTEAVARRKLKQAQVPLLDRLRAAIKS